MFIPRLILEFFGFEVDTEKDGNAKKKELPDTQKNESQKKHNKRDYKEIPVEEPRYNNKEDTTKSKLRLIEVKETNKNKENDKAQQNDLIKSKAIRVVECAPDMAFTIDIEKITGKGDDAPPILKCFKDNSCLISIADGMGGAGGTIYEIDNSKHSGAYLASRAVNSIAEKYLIGFKELGYEIDITNYENIAKDFKYHFDSGLAQILDKIHKRSNSKLNLKSNLIKRLPTTFALSYIKNQNGGLKIFNYWAGDSRIYILAPENGLNQLTNDDLTEKGDAFENLLNDSPLSNCVHADKNYKINTNWFNINTPVIVFASTDGAFGYLPTPVHFEYLLLETLANSYNISDWKRTLEKEFKKNQADDISLSFILFGFKNFIEIKDSFYPRKAKLNKELDKVRSSEIELLKQEGEIIESNKIQQKIDAQIREFENDIYKSSEDINSLTRSVNGMEYDIKSMENILADKKREIEQFEEKIQNKVNDMLSIRDEIETTEIELQNQKSKLSKFKGKHKNDSTQYINTQLTLLTEKKNKLKLDLWQKFKQQYENYLKAK